MKRACILLTMAVLGACSSGTDSTPITVIITGDSTVALNGTLQLDATAWSGNTPFMTGMTFVWFSSDTTKVSVSQSGLVTGLQLGTAEITAVAVPAVSANTVTSAPYPVRSRIGRIVFKPFDVAFAALNDSMIVTADARDALNVSIPGIVFTWQSRNPNIVSIADSGTHAVIAHAVASGTTVIVATTDGVSDSVTATVP
ncbi:MAG TPA: Ig-like domain-containing protein [Gemmatimonadales bacterium]|nr:Ig-like domain-containing protein [Gemmatimonadales bacterium]